MVTRIVEVVNRKQRRQFVSLPRSIYDDDPAWVPPLTSTVGATLDPRRGPFFEHGEAALFIALDRNIPVGRISAHINRSHNELHEDDVGFFGFFECVQSQPVCDALFDHAEKWLTSKGMRYARGPMSFTINDEVGLLIRGFDYPPKIMMGHNPPYYQQLLETRGYEKVKDLMAWDYVTNDVPELATRLASRVQEKEGLTIRQVEAGNIGREIHVIMDVFNSAWSENWGFVPLSETEVRKTAADLEMIIDPRIALVAEFEGEPVAIAIAFPDVNQLIMDLNGRLFPTGAFKLLRRIKQRQYTDARLVLLGIRKEWRKKLSGLSMALYVQMHSRCRSIGLRGGELGWTLEDNHRINRGIELMGGIPYKTYRVYQKELPEEVVPA